MIASSFAESNHVLGRPSGMTAEECDPLSVHISQDPPVVISCWKLTRAELAEIKLTGRVWLWIWGRTMPPAVLTIASPFGPQTLISEGEPAYWWLQTRAGQQWALIPARDAAAAVLDLERFREYLPQAQIRLATASEIERETGPLF